jgi:Predicted phage phi-C31 gp36 major capsid-like protein
MPMSRREQTIQTLQDQQVRTFYQDLVRMVNTRAAGNSLTDAGLLIPELVMNRIEDRMGDYATVAREVEMISVGGTSRIILDGADPEAIWVEMSGAISEVTAGFKKVELDGFKLAGYMVIPNDIIDDAMINLAEYVEKKLAKGIAKSRDKAIVTGTGAAGKQMVGIIPSLATANKPAAIPFDLGAILSKIALVDDGDETYGEIIAVMKRSTFYHYFVKNMITVDSAGRYVVPSLSQPNIGVRVVFSQYMPASKVLFGDYKRYIVAQRSGIKLEMSTDVRFIEDQTVIKGLQRMDGKPINVDASGKTKDWVLVEITDPAPVNP